MFKSSRGRPIANDEFTDIKGSNLPTVGIDVGSTFMSVAFKNGNHVEVLANKNGDRLTPCVISFSDNDTLIGDIALSQISHNASNTILNILNFLGRRFNDPEVADLIARSPVKIVNFSGVIGFDVEIGDGKRKILNAVEAMSILLSEMRNVATTYLGQEVNRAVISIPGFFDGNQRNAMGNAAKLAGFTEIKVITDVLAACRSYHGENSPNGNILVFNMGESSVNATIISNNNGQKTVRSSSHDENFGGKNIDEVIRNFLISRFNEKHGTNLQDSPEIICKLEGQVKTLKHNFSKSIKERVFIENLSDGNGLDISLTKVRFDILCNDILTSAFEHVATALEKAQLTNTDIKCVVLSGGSANLSKLREMFAEEFEDVASNENNFHEIVVRGAAFEASLLVPSSLEEVNSALEEVVIADENNSDNYSGVRRKIKTCAPTTNTKSGDSSEVAIGIDLGTTNTCVAVVRNGQVEIIANSMGNRITPSFVAFTEAKRLVGDAAKSQFIENPLNTIFDAKRLIGRNLNEEEIQNRLQDWPFTVSSRNDNPQFDVSFQNRIRHISPEEISAAVLTEIKTSAEAFIGRTVKKAVITVPAYFNDSQRQATLDAGKIAGLQVLKIINEPTAAAIAFGLDCKIVERKNVLVFDLGGGTFDVAVLAIAEGNFQVLAVSGNMDLGGGDFDSRLVDYFIRQFNKTHPIDIRKNPVALAKLRTECEKIKINLSFSKTVKFTIENFIDDIQFTSSITRANYEDICSDLIESTLEPVEDVLRESGLDKSQIHEVVLAGGGTRMPKIQEQLVEFFDGKKLNKSTNPDEAVACGAALHAAVLVGETSVDDILLTDVTSHSLGIDVELDCFTHKLIHKNTPLPATELGYFTTMFDNQPNVYIHIYEGENHESKDNRYLGRFTLDNIQKAPKHVPVIEVTYSIDENAILHVTAKDLTTNVSKSIDVIANKGRLEDSDISRMIAEGLEFETASLDENNKNKLRIDLANYCYMLKRSIRVKRQNIDIGEFAAIDQLCNRTICWTDETNRIDSEECQRRKTELENMYQEAIA